MPIFGFNLILSATLISTALFIARTNPVLGGFIISLPLSSLITLAVSKIQSNNPGDTFALAKSIFVGVPFSLVFFVPFLFADKYKINFWAAYAAGIVLLVIGYFIHRRIFS